MRVLLVEDEINLLLGLEQLLIDEGYDVLTATNGEEAYEIFENNFIDVIVTDLIMPKMNGSSFIFKVRKISKTLPIIVISGFSDYFKDLDVYCRLEKPFDDKVLLEKISNAIVFRKYNYQERIVKRINGLNKTLTTFLAVETA